MCVCVCVCVCVCSCGARPDCAHVGARGRAVCGKARATGVWKEGPRREPLDWHNTVTSPEVKQSARAILNSLNLFARRSHSIYLLVTLN